MKRGASFKAVQMVNNALSCRPGIYNTHDSSSRRSSRRASASNLTNSSPTEKALINYNLSLSVKEQVGGVFWAWKRIFTGKIYSEEGIWLHGEYIGKRGGSIVCILLHVDPPPLIHLNSYVGLHTFLSTRSTVDVSNALASCSSAPFPCFDTKSLNSHCCHHL
jgi:hypothetical protein